MIHLLSYDKSGFGCFQACCKDCDERRRKGQVLRDVVSPSFVVGDVDAEIQQLDGSSEPVLSWDEMYLGKMIWIHAGLLHL